MKEDLEQSTSMAIINSMHIIPNKEHQFVELISNNN